MKVIGIVLLVLVVAFFVFEAIGLVRDIIAKRRKNLEDNENKGEP